MATTHRHLLAATLAVPLIPVAGRAAADDVEGEVESVNAEARSFTVQGMEIATDERTDYDDGLTGFADIAVGQRVEVDFEDRGGRRVATEVEREEPRR